MNPYDLSAVAHINNMHPRDLSLKRAHQAMALFKAEDERLRQAQQDAIEKLINANDTLTRCQAECTRLLEENRKLEALLKSSNIPALCQCDECQDICVEFGISASGDQTTASPQS